MALGSDGSDSAESQQLNQSLYAQLVSPEKGLVRGSWGWLLDQSELRGAKELVNPLAGRVERHMGRKGKGGMRENGKGG